MRRMNYDRFANPTNFGEYDTENKRFVMDKNIEPGFYFIKIYDTATDAWYSATMVLTEGHDSGSSVIASYENETALYLYWSASYERYLSPLNIQAEPYVGIELTLIYLYKLD